MDGIFWYGWGGVEICLQMVALPNIGGALSVQCRSLADAH